MVNKKKWAAKKEWKRRLNECGMLICRIQLKYKRHALKSLWMMTHKNAKEWKMLPFISHSTY